MTYQEFYQIRDKIKLSNHSLNNYERKIFASIMKKIETCCVIPEYLSQVLRDIDKRYNA